MDSRRCPHCSEEIKQGESTHYCSTRNETFTVNAESTSSDDSDFLVSAVIGAATNSALLGGVLGGDMVGGIVGDMFDGNLFD